MSKDEIEVIDNLDDVPNLKTPEEKAAYWSTHKPSRDFWRNAEPPPEDTLPPRTKTISLRLEQDTLQKLKALASRREERYQTLLKEFVAERLREEETGRRTIAGEAKVVEEAYRHYQQQNQLLQEQLTQNEQQLSTQSQLIENLSQQVDRLGQQVDRLGQQVTQGSQQSESYLEGLTHGGLYTTSGIFETKLNPTEIPLHIGLDIAASATDEAEMNMMENKANVGILPLAGQSE